MNLILAIRSFLFFIVLVIYLSSCSTPKAVLRMFPVQENTRWFFGKEYANALKDSISIAACFDYTDGTHLIMDVEVTNFSTQAILIDPAKFYYYTLSDSSRNKVTTTTYISIQKHALDPEAKLLHIDKELSREEANVKNTQAFLITTAILATVATVAVVASKDKKDNKNTQSGNEQTNNYNHQNNNNNREKNEAAVNLWGFTMNMLGDAAVNSAVNYQFNTANLKTLRDTWEEIPLRKSHLYPNESIRGKVVYPIHPVTVPYLRFYYPIERTEIQFLFRQVLHSVGF